MLTESKAWQKRLQRSWKAFDRTTAWYTKDRYDPIAMQAAKDHHEATIQAHNDWCLANADALRLAFHPSSLC